MPTSSEAATGSYVPVLVPDQTYNRSEYEDSTPEKINTNTDTLPEVPSGIDQTSNNNWLTSALLITGVTLAVIAAAVLPAVIVSQVINTTSTTQMTTTSSGSTTLPTSSISASNSTNSASNSSTSSSSNSSANSSSSTSSTASTTGGSTTTLCPTNTCTFVTWYTLTSSGYYGVENVNFTCTQTLSNFTAFIYVQKTVGATYAQQYNTFWGGVMNQTYSTTSSQIIYSWKIISGQTISSSGYPYFIEAQFQLQGTNQTVANDTYSITTQSACNGQVSTYSGHF